MERPATAHQAFLSEAAHRFGVTQRRLAVAVQAAERLTREEFAVVEELLSLEADARSDDRRQRVAEGLKGVVEFLRSRVIKDPLADVDDPIDAKGEAAACLWSDLESRANRNRLLRDCVSAEEAGRLTGRSRQAVEKQRRAGRMVALRQGRQWRYPVWQFDADGRNGLVPGLSEVLDQLHLSPAGAALWLTTPKPELDGTAPIQVLTNRETRRVVDLARQQGFLP